jgi:UDP-N-acetylmuramoyl-L-alanyl-D-glutamate--2,6-diaminopimelate ligase
VIITSDNPRSEDPDQIITDILEGVPTIAERDRDYVVLPDRKEAIEYAIDCASEGDLVLIAGKGHEDYQILKSGTIQFDDRQVAGDSLKRRLNRD